MSGAPWAENSHFMLKSTIENAPGKIYICHAIIADAARGMKYTSGKQAVMTMLWYSRQHDQQLDMPIMPQF
jgi:hypothetical protein